MSQKTGVDPMECVAVGAAIQGSILGGETHDILLLDVTSITDFYCCFIVTRSQLY